jgi:hypothetical protein
MNTKPYRAEMGEPPMPDEGPTDPMPKPMSIADRMGNRVIGKPSDLKPEERKKLSRMPMEPVKKYAKGGSVRGDGCCSKGHTKGKMV